MTIALHISRKDDPHNFMETVFRQAAHQFPGDHFIFIYDAPLPGKLLLPDNCTPVQLGPEIRNSLVRHYWYNYKIPSILNRYHADVLFTPREVCSLNTAVPQIMIPGAIMRRTGGYREQFRKKYAERASFIAAFEKIVFANALRTYPAHKQKIKYVGHGLSLPEQTETEAKKQAENDPYFAAMITEQSPAQITMLLKAFSIFKKLQRSSYKLFLIIRSKNPGDPVPNFSSYKYRQEVKWINETRPAGPDQIMAGAFANIQLFHNSPGMQIELKAMASGAPLISTCPVKERDNYFEAAALYAENTEAGIAEQMMRLYKDENLYREYSLKAREFSALFSWQKTAASLFDLAEKAVAQTP